MSIYNNIFTSIRLTNIKINYAFCIFTNRNKRWGLLSHYRNIDFLVRSHSCCRPILYFKQMRNSVFFSNKIKTVPYSIQFYCNFFLKYYPSFILKFSDSPIDSFLTFWYGGSRCACHSGLCSRFWNCHICWTKRRLWTMHYNTAQVRITCFTVAFLYVADGQYA